MNVRFWGFLYILLLSHYVTAPLIMRSTKSFYCTFILKSYLKFKFYSFLRLISHFVTAIAPLSLGELREAVRSRLNNKNSINNTLLPLTKAKIL